MNGTLRKTIAAMMATSALAATSASAITVIDLGKLPPAGIAHKGPEMPKYAWDGFNGIEPNLGWAHNSQWFTFTVPRTSTVEIRFASWDTAGELHPAFTMWKTTGNFVGGNHLSHVYNQVGLTGSSAFLAPQTPGADGAIRFIGYANAGPNFVNGDGKKVLAGTKGISARNAARSKSAVALTLKKGQYLLALGGSCNDQSCGAPDAKKPFRLTIGRLPFLK